jgi:integrase
MGLMSSVLNQARKEWGLIKANPLSDVRKPPNSAPRVRRPTQEELEKLADVAGSDLTKAQVRVYRAFLLAVETGMRAGEIAGLTQKTVDRGARVCHLAMTKNGTSRDVGLSLEAVRLLEELPVLDPVWGLKTSQIDALWRKICKRAGVENLHFHDRRHEAITRLARKLDGLSLARMIGHRNLNELMSYYNESAAELAKRLD